MSEKMADLVEQSEMLHHIVALVDVWVGEHCANPAREERLGSFCEQFGCSTLASLVAPARKFYPAPTKSIQLLTEYSIREEARMEDVIAELNQSSSKIREVPLEPD